MSQNRAFAFLTSCTTLPYTADWFTLLRNSTATENKTRQDSDGEIIKRTFSEAAGVRMRRAFISNFTGIRDEN